ncbi:MAG: hypothetical protein LJE94_10730 [Deltaproteobacteria bacterium]|nr:hypothetical protein [Deltaproteobacteria bacterium]
MWEDAGSADHNYFGGSGVVQVDRQDGQGCASRCQILRGKQIPALTDSIQ